MIATEQTASTLQLKNDNHVIQVRSLWSDAWRRLLKNRLAVVGLIIIAFFFLMAIFGRAIAPYDFLEQDLDNSFQGPTADHLFGTDALGRDVLSRLLWGARTAAIVALVSTVLSLIVGVAVGTTAGFMRGRVDEFLMWMTDVTMSLPDLLLVLMLNTVLKRPIIKWFDAMYQETKNPFFLNPLWLDFVLVFGALALISWAGYARLIRGQVLSITQTTYVESARAIGSSQIRIMLRHIIPNSFGPIVVAVTAGMGGAIGLESALSFLGVGVQPPNASWGKMLSEGLDFWRTYPHLMLVPAVTIGIIIVGFTFLGDGLNDALNPRQQKK